MLIGLESTITNWHSNIDFKEKVTFYNWIVATYHSFYPNSDQEDDIFEQFTDANDHECSSQEQDLMFNKYDICKMLVGELQNKCNITTVSSQDFGWLTVFDDNNNTNNVNETSGTNDASINDDYDNVNNDNVNNEIELVEEEIIEESVETIENEYIFNSIRTPYIQIINNNNRNEVLHRKRHVIKDWVVRRCNSLLKSHDSIESVKHFKYLENQPSSSRLGEINTTRNENCDHQFKMQRKFHKLFHKESKGERKRDAIMLLFR
ncbi:hypothetical protein Kpol_385p11 [Vanderwaltozyma polyspora DSM 70294]|uniref:Uncharacterized protein n=1 Tax=Vanderwaltozyma polyspora (strain ATCC 22028 / DSM 70294 / BCRC 21397 / CBS 2163 / NBRC 10782 / NRRL Y-8283 / UCD 57-17) TaxID=436907 RepID=A7TS23_VANPO|nr:uncharacterized protein Kpol_385p11 [Vanderwaltozyma polyspora DSM 70294]EDO14942.1 hypothetical protein Kpol_385p11 [Vanderwaltozyma polyspora DSM 70294]